MSKFLIVIPARYGSTRFPGKPLHLIAGKPMIQWVWEQASSCKLADDIIIATDDERIAQVVDTFGGRFMMTSSEHATGTDRLIEVIEQETQATHIINVQGDEPLIEPELIDSLIQTLKDQPEVPMVTAATPFKITEDINDSNMVKVAINQLGKALYFSRSPIPFTRQFPEGLVHYRHLGIYGYQRELLMQWNQLKPSLLEQAEQLEQLRALDNGVDIAISITESTHPGIDTLEQAQALEEWIIANNA